MKNELPAVSLVVIQAADLDRSRLFYESLGVKLQRERHGMGIEHFSADLGGTVFEIYPSHGTAQTRSRIGFRVGSVLAAVEAVLGLGANMASPPSDGPWGMRAVVIDPDGHRVELTESKS